MVKTKSGIRMASATDETVMFDVAAMAKGHKFYSLRPGSVTTDESIIAFSTDTVGRRIYTLRVKDLASGKMLDDNGTRMASSLKRRNV